MRYFDTGVLLKLYLPEPRAVEAVAFVTSNSQPPLITPLHELEMRSALRQKFGRGEITEEECAALIHQIDADISSGVLERKNVAWSGVFSRAESLSAANGVSTLCRSLDLLHVALATELGATEFCTFDRRQSLMAVAAGLILVQ